MQIFLKNFLKTITSDSFCAKLPGKLLIFWRESANLPGYNKETLGKALLAAPLMLSAFGRA